MALNEMINHPELSYGKRIGTYVGLPLERAKETADILQGKYDQSKQAANELEIALANMDLHGQDEAIRGEAQSQLNTVLNSVKEKGNWEDASYLVQNSAKDVATNRGLLAALESQKQKKQQQAALEARVQKGEILQEDLEYELQKAEENYQGVSINPVTNSWQGFYEMGNPPKYIDIGDYTNKFLNGFKPDQWMGMYVKGKDGKWYKGRQTGDRTVDGQYIYMPTTEEATYDEVYKAAREHAMQNQQIKERLDYDVQKGYPTFAEKLANDPDARKAMEDDLINVIGLDSNTISNLSDEDLAKLHHKETMIHQAIDGSALKHSYRKEKFQSMGMAWEAKLYLNNLKNAARGGGDEKTVEVEKNYVQLTSSAYKPNGLPYSTKDYNDQYRAMDADLDKTNRHIETLLKEKAEYEKNGQEVPQWHIQKLADANIEAARKQAQIRNYEKHLQQAQDKVKKEKGIEYKSVEQLQQEAKEGFSEEVINDTDEALALVQEYYGTIYGDQAEKRFLDAVKGLQPNEAGRLFNPIISAKKPTFGDFTEDQKRIQNRLRELHGKNNGFQNVLFSGGKNAAGYLEKYLGAFVEAKEYDADVSQAFKDINDNKSTNYAYLDLSTQTNKSGENINSNYSNRATAIVQRNPGNFRVINKDGEEMSWVRDGGGSTLDGEYDLHNLRVLGPTTDYIHNYGYGFKAVVNPSKEELKDNPNALPQELIVVQSTGNSLLELTKFEMKRGLAIKGDEQVVGTGSKGIDAVDDYIYKLTYQEMDKQLSVFQQFPPIPPANKNVDKESFSVDISVSADRSAKVTRNVYHDGSVDYEIEAWQVKGAKSNGKKEKVKGYNDLFDVEMALEKFAGFGADNAKYSVDLNTLVGVSNEELPYGKISSNMQSMPRLVKPFKNEFYKLAADAQIDFTITSMTRSKDLNKRYNGDPESGHLKGEGVDISLKDDAGKAFRKWLDANSEAGSGRYRKVKGYNIIYDVHDRGSGEHIDMKWSKAN